MKLPRFLTTLVTLSGLGVLAQPSARAEIILAAPLSDHAVLQRNLPVPVWGSGIAGQTITVHYRGQSQHAVVGADGRWSVRLDPMPANAEGAKLTVVGDDEEEEILYDVVVGEVWLASGQSNMGRPLSRTRNAKEEVANANFPLIRHLRIEQTASDSPVDTVKTGGWQLATPGTAGNFTAVGYFFARELALKLGIPIGIINSSWGGTPIESWLAESVLRTTKAWRGFNEEWEKALKVFPQKMAGYPALDAAWRAADEESRLTGKPNPLPWPIPPVGPGTAYAPGALYNGMIVPLAPYALRGALWYQGEGNTRRADEYAELFTAMICDWRKTWNQGNFHFLFVQLPNYADGNATGRNWARLREGQTAALTLPNVGAAITIDAGEADDIHPADKKTVGERLALLAEADVYNLPVKARGPWFKSASLEGKQMRVTFTDAEGLETRATSLTGFELAGTDRIFHPAAARIEGETVIVSARDVPAPVAVRYAWINSPVVSLFNAAGLPAAPFRTDDWSN